MVAIGSGIDVPVCPACLAEGAPRDEYGCDADAPEPVWEGTCLACGGMGVDCRPCGGSGLTRFLRCPMSMLRAHPLQAASVAPAMRSWTDLDRGLLPVAGGRLDQACTFLAACGIADAARRGWEEKEQAQRDKEEERMRRLAQHQGAELRKRGGRG